MERNLADMAVYCASHGTVPHDGGIYRMWYQAWPRDWNGQNCDLIGYAESRKGLDWRKPKLGLVDYGDEGKENNLVDLGGHPPSVFIDPEAPATHRYRATLCSGAGHQGVPIELTGYGYYTAHSPDGFRWQFRQSLARTAETGDGVFGAVDVTLAYQAAPGDRWVHVAGRPGLH